MIAPLVAYQAWWDTQPQARRGRRALSTMQLRRTVMLLEADSLEMVADKLGVTRSSLKVALSRLPAALSGRQQTQQQAAE